MSKENIKIKKRETWVIEALKEIKQINSVEKYENDPIYAFLKEQLKHRKDFIDDNNIILNNKLIGISWYEQEIFGLWADGMSVKEISNKVHITIYEVRKIINKIQKWHERNDRQV